MPWTGGCAVRLVARDGSLELLKKPNRASAGTATLMAWRMCCCGQARAHVAGGFESSAYRCDRCSARIFTPSPTKTRPPTASRRRPNIAPKWRPA